MVAESYNVPGMASVYPVCTFHDSFRSQQPAFPRNALRHLCVHSRCYPLRTQQDPENILSIL